MSTSARCAARGLAAALLAFAGAAAPGELNFNPYVAGQYEFDSNIYRFSQQVAEAPTQQDPTTPGTPTPVTDDRIRRYRAGADLSYRWQQQNLQLMGEYRRLQFDRFTYLDHDEHAFAVAVEGAILDATRVQAELRDERRMASFQDRRSKQLILEREQIGHADLNVALTPAWHAITGARARRVRSPLPDAPALAEPAPGVAARSASPEFAVHEVGVNAGAQYGIENKEHPELEAPLRIGALLDYSTVDFSGVTPQPDPPPGVTRETFDGYSLLALVFTGAYAVSEISSLDAKLGLVRYNPTHGSATARPNLTGEVGYARKLTVLTDVNAHLFRRIVPNVATADSTTDTGLSLGARWEAIRDLTMLADYSIASSTFGGLSRIAPENAGRSDRVQNATLSLAYPKLHTLYLRVYGRYSDRRSNRTYDNFDDVTVGAELSFRWNPPKAGVE